tara:strand:- start:27 stop:1541 length:1515 start_codon:yes stop_codon:yes gene_type:complete
MSKLDILFINPNSSKKAYQELAATYAAIEPPTWSLLLAKSLSQICNVSILDCDALRMSDEKAVEEIEYLKPKLICFVIYGQNPNSGTTSMIGAESLAKNLKEANSKFKIIFIGSHSSALPMEVLNKSFIDYISINEGVETLRQLIQTNFEIEQVKKVNGLGYKDEKNPILTNPSQTVKNLDLDLPGYSWDLLPYNNKQLDLYRAHYWHTYFKEKDRTPFAAIYTSLGCQFKCNFCMINILNRNSNDLNKHAADFKGMRYWSPEFILEQIGILSDLGVKTLRLADEMFFLNKKYYIPILEGIIERGYDLNMWAYARVDTVREDQLELFKKAGINWLALGIEAGNQNVRLDIEKGKFRDVNISDVVKLIQKYDINVLGNYMFGFPEDDLSTMSETLNLALELNTEHANFYATSALPGSPLYFYAKENNWDLPKEYDEFAFLSYECKPLKTNHISAKEVLKFRDNAWHKYFENDKYLNLVEKKFGLEAKSNVIEMSKIKLKRRLLNN